MAIDSIGGGGGITGMGSAKPVAGTSAAGAPDFDAILKSFLDEASKTPAQRAREAVLDKHHLSEADYQKLPKEERSAIDREIVEAVKRATAARTDPRTDDLFAKAAFGLNQI